MRIALLAIACAAGLTVGAGTASAQHGYGGHAGGHYGNGGHYIHPGYSHHGGFGFGGAVIVAPPGAPVYVAPPVYAPAYGGYGVGGVYSSGGLSVGEYYAPRPYWGGGFGYHHHGHH